MRVRRNTESGFTLIALMIVVAIIAIIAAIAIPNLLSARLNANETAAISTLRNRSSGQAQFQATAKADEDNDGTGEFGLFAELSGLGIVRGSTTRLNPPVLSGAFRTLTPSGQVSRSGYVYVVGVPSASGTVIYETDAAGTLNEPANPDLAETTWASYATPVRRDVA